MRSRLRWWPFRAIAAIPFAVAFLVVSLVADLYDLARRGGPTRRPRFTTGGQEGERDRTDR